MASRDATARALAELLGIFHNITYYAPEMKAFADLGLPEYWRAYMAYRSAPMGMVSPAVVSATFYNFAPRVVAAAIPSAWESATPAEAMALRDECIARALHRALGPQADAVEIAQAADLALQGIDGCEAGARPLYGAHAELPIPEDPVMRLWHACTLWREHRGDGHNIALAAAGIDGVGCHVLLAARGVGSKAIITKIRGWTSEEWDHAQALLEDRTLVDPEGAATEAGLSLRREIEATTDRLAEAPRLNLGAEHCDRLIALMEPVVATLVESGAVAARWPPPKPPTAS